MNDDPEKVTYFGITDARNKRVPFGIKAKDRTRHLYAIGKTGMGKSNLLEVLAIQDIKNGNGVCFIDPHGKTADLLMEHIPKERINDVLYFAPFDTDYPISFNVLEDVGFDKRHLVVAGLMSSFKKIWQDAWSARMEYILTNTLLALLEYPNATLLLVNKMLSDKDFRKKVVENVSDVSVKSFWVDEFAKYTDRMAAEATPAIQNKVGQFTSNPLIRNILGQPKSSFDLREMMDNKKIIIVNLSKGRIGEANAQLLGGMFVTKIYLAAMSRADVSEEILKQLPPFYLYVDEFQSFANESFADILAEARKYKLSLNIAHQYIEQMPEEVRSAVFGNVGTMITFRVGATDAEHLEKEFAPTFNAEDFVNLGRFQMYLKLMIDEVGSQPFSAMGLPPIEKEADTFFEQIVEASRNNFAKPKDIVDKQVLEMLNIGANDSSNSSNKNQNQNQNNKNNYHKFDKNKNSQSQHGNKIDKNQNKKHDQKEKLKPMFDNKTKKMLDDMLAESKEEDIEKEDVSGELKKAIDNKNKKPHKQDPKKVSSENRGDLKSALATALGGSLDLDKDKKEKKEDRKDDKKEEIESSIKNKDTKKQVDKKEKKDKNNDSKEIEEKDLKKILED